LSAQHPCAVHPPYQHGKFPDAASDGVRDEPRVPAGATIYGFSLDYENLRGYDFNQGHLLERMKRYVPAVIPVFMGALRHANNTAMALDTPSE
jgi:hypothetical protein